MAHKKVKNLKTQKKKFPSTKKVYALIYYSNEVNPHKVYVKDLSDNFFNYKGRSYNISLDNVMTLKRKTLLGVELYIFYYYDNNEPLCINEGLKTKSIPNSVIYTALRSDAIKKANDIKKDMDINMYYIVGAVVFVVVVYFMMGGFN